MRSDGRIVRDSGRTRKRIYDVRKKLEVSSIKKTGVGMALIECSECKSQISDKASACPKCGNPMKETVSSNPDQLACPNCKSTNIHIDKKGFDGGSACCGALACGPLGLLAGQSGANVIKKTCLKCNHSWVGEAKKYEDSGPGI